MTGTTLRILAAFTALALALAPRAEIEAGEKPTEPAIGLSLQSRGEDGMPISAATAPRTSTRRTSTAWPGKGHSSPFFYAQPVCTASRAALLTG